MREIAASFDDDDDVSRRRDRDRMLYMSPIRAKMHPAVLDRRDEDLDEMERALKRVEKMAVERQIERAAESKRRNRANSTRSLRGGDPSGSDAGGPDGAAPLRRRRQRLTGREKSDEKCDAPREGSASLSPPPLARPGRDGVVLGAGPFSSERASRENMERENNNKSDSDASKASKIFGKEETAEVLQLAAPALGSLLADPLMSLVDTAVIGNHGSTSLAALGPNTAVFQIVFQLFSFLSITTTGMVARACADGDNRVVRRALANASILALVFGGATCLGLNAFAADVLRLMGCSPDLVAAATPYLRVRAFAVPAVLFCTSAQGGCLGQQDARTPLVIFIVAGVINAFGDFWAVQSWGLGLGLAGAAWATLAAQYVSALLFFWTLSRRKMLPSRWAHWRLPTVAETRDICAVSGMLLLGSLCRMGVYTMMTVTALACGTLTMAAHQVALQIFWTLTYFVDPLFVAATSFIARDHGRRPERVRRMAWLLLRLSVGVGAFIAVVCYLIPTFAAGTFTTDPTLATMIGSIAPLMGTAQLVSAVVLVAEGVLIGCGDLRYLLKVHCLNFFALGALLWWVRHSGLGLHGIWIAVLANQLLRLSQHAAHVWRGGGPDLLDRATKAAAGDGGG